MGLAIIVLPSSTISRDVRPSKRTSIDFAFTPEGLNFIGVTRITDVIAGLLDASHLPL